MKNNIKKWLGCGLVLMIALGSAGVVSHASAHKVIQPNPQYQTIQPVSPKRKQPKVTIKKITAIPNQGYTNYVTGQNALFSLPGTMKGARVLYGKRAMKRFSRMKTRFMAYQLAVTSKGSGYYKIVSLHHSVRGWMYQSAIRSLLNRRQQAADLVFNSQITNAEMVADQSKHESLANQSKVNLKAAHQFMGKARASVRALKGTPDYSLAKASLRNGQRYLRKLAKVQPSVKTMAGLSTIRSEYNQAAKYVSAAQVASAKHQTKVTNRNIKLANRSLRHVSRILSKIHNRHDRRAAMTLFNQALSYVNNNYSFVPASDINGRKMGRNKLSNDQTVTLIEKYEDDAQNSIMNLYPNLNNFDVTLMDAYRAQNDLNQANDLVASLKGAHVRKTVLRDIKTHQHNINNLWNV